MDQSLINEEKSVMREFYPKCANTNSVMANKGPKILKIELL